MQVLVVVPFAFHRETGSSLSTYYRILVLSEVVDSVTVITTPHGKDINGNKIKIIRTPSRKFFQTYEPGEYFKRSIYEIFLFFKTIKLLISIDYQAVFIHGTSIYWGFLLNYFFKLPVVATVHGNIQVDLEKWNVSSNPSLKKLASKVENKMISSFSYIIAEHESVRKILLDAGIKTEKIRLIRIAVKKVNASVTTRINEKFVILYTGTFVKIQNIDLLYDMMSVLPVEKFELIVVGGNEKEIEREKLKIKEKALENKIRLIPRQEQIDLKKYYDLADVVVSPREYGHDTPMKIFDYLNFGKCILATDMPVHTEILNNDVAFLVKPTPGSFASKMLELREKPELIKQKEAKARTCFEENFSFEIMVRAYGELVASLLK
jgi:glycosyltransferase involved in cell wall biosynthesis